MSKERLEEIIEKVKRSDEYAEKGLWEASDGIIVHLHNEGYINYLIERVQELEEENKRIRQMKYHEAYEQGKFDTNMKVWYEIPTLEQQNKRYREALEFYADKGTYEVIETSPPTDEYQQPIEPVFKTVPIIYYDKGKEARKALESDSDE